MKRDMDLIRLILISVESGEDVEELSKYSDDEYGYHCCLLYEHGMVLGCADQYLDGSYGVNLTRLTWEGHDFLDAARNDTFWRKTKQQIADVGGAWTFELVKELLQNHIGRALLGA